MKRLQPRSHVTTIKTTQTATTTRSQPLERFACLAQLFQSNSLTFFQSVFPYYPPPKCYLPACLMMDPNYWVWERAWRLRTPAILAEDLAVVPLTCTCVHGASQTSVIRIPGHPTCSFDLRAPGMRIAHMHTGRQNTHNKSKNKPKTNPSTINLLISRTTKTNGKEKERIKE